MIWFTADWHLQHKNIIEYCDRPFKNVKEMDRTIIKNYQGAVDDDDIVYFVGDLTLASMKYLDWLKSVVARLPGQKHLIMGNHDYLHPRYYIEAGFLSIHTGLVEPNTGWILAHDPAKAIYDDKYYICGHIHNLFKSCKNVINVGVDVWDFEPVPIESLRAKFFGYD